MADRHGSFVWYELATTDAGAAKAFYTAVVGWDTRDASTSDTAYTLFTAADALVGGMMDLPQSARKMGAAPRWLGYVAVDNVDETAGRLKRLGGAVHLPPTDVGDTGRMAVVADPQTAPLALFKRRASDDGQTAALNSPGQVGWHELFAANWQTAFPFYGALFGWQKVEADVGAMGTYQLFAAAGQTIGGMSNKPTTVPTPFWLYYFNVSDIDTAAKRVTAAGGQVLDGPLEAPGGGRIARCMDPQGAMFALTGQRSKKEIGYFEPVASRDPAAARVFVPNKRVP